MGAKEFRVLNLGAGVQSTTLYLKFALGHFDYPNLRPDVAIFADTQDEPKAVYEHLEWLEKTYSDRIPIWRRTIGRLGDDLSRGIHSAGQRFASIPAFTTAQAGRLDGQTRRQCSREYKVDVVERAIRRELVGCAPGARIPKDVRIHQYIGISLDEAGRAVRLRERFKERAPIWSVSFPLIDLRWTRSNCLGFLEQACPHSVPRSACVFCPYHSDDEWRAVRAVPEDWARAIAVDAALRTTGSIANRDMTQSMYVHRACVPLDQVEFKHERQFNMFTTECEGMCGN